MWTTRGSRSQALAALAGGDVLALAFLRPRAATLHGLASPHRWVAAIGTDAATAQLAGLALWLLATWLGIGLAACAASAVPGAVGRGAGHLARGTLPRAIYRLAAGAVGVGVLCAPVSAMAAGPATPSQHRVAAVPGPAPAWPTDDPVPAPHWPTSVAPTARPRPPMPAHHRATPTPPPTNTVVVAAGDSLWRIAAAHLPARHPTVRRIATAWPRWYAANRGVIGADPNQLSPGQHLAVPASQHATAEEDPS